MPPLSGRVALVTGASRGIGRSIAVALARAGAHVGVAARTLGDLSEVAAEIGAAGGTARAAAGDVSIPADVTRIVESVGTDLGPINLLVNNAGIGSTGGRPDERLLWEQDREAWWRVVTVNLRGPMLCCHAVLPSMITAGFGHVFNINSLAGNRATPVGSAYGVSKGALFRMTESLGAALAGTGVAIFDVSPGLVRTDMTKDLSFFQNLPDDAWTPADRVGELIVRLAGGGYEELSGRFIHVKDDPDALLAAVRRDPASHMRRLRLVPAGTDDAMIASGLRRSD